MMRTLKAFAMGALACSAIGCYGTAGYSTGGYGYRTPSVAVVTTAPPQPIYETPPPAPFPSAVWAAGSWDWNPSAERYTWAGGRWVTAPRAGVVYQQPAWQNQSGGWVRTPGRWVPGQAVDRMGRHVWYDGLGRPHYF